MNENVVDRQRPLKKDADWRIDLEPTPLVILLPTSQLIRAKSYTIERLQDATL